MKTIQINEHVLLKEVELSDAPDLFQAIDSQRAYLREWLPFVDLTLEVAETEKYIRSIVTAPPESRDRTFIIRYEGLFAGLIGLKTIDRVNRKTEIGYWLSEKYQQKGIMTASVKALVDFAFRELHLHRIQIKCGTGNIRSKKIPQRLHFQLEGIERDGELLSDGRFTDLETYSLLNDRE